MQQAPSQPFVVTIVPASPAQETTLGDVVLGALGIAGLLVLAALVLGVIFALLRLAWIRRHPAEDDHMPPVNPLVPPSVDRSPPPPR